MMCALCVGFPRNMVDTVEYLNQVGRLDGVILLNWSEDTLIKQVQIEDIYETSLYTMSGRDTWKNCLTF
jgi:hypothetical protein